MSEFKHTIQAIDEFGRLIVDNYKAELEACGYQDGALYRTISYSIKSGSNMWSISIKLEEYWRYIEMVEEQELNFHLSMLLKNGLLESK